MDDVQFSEAVKIEEKTNQLQNIDIFLEFAENIDLGTH